MKKWIMLVFKINRQLDGLFDKLEMRIHRLSLNSAIPAVKLYDKIIDLNNKKSRLINLRILYNIMVEALTDSELSFMQDVCEQRRYFKDDCNEKRGKVGELNRLVGVCKSVVIKAGFSTKQLESEYSNLFVQKSLVA